MRRLLSAAMLTAAAGVALPMMITGVALGSTPPITPIIGAHGAGNVVDLVARLDRGPEQRKGSSTTSAPRILTFAVPACPGNEPGAGAGTIVDTNCTRAADLCRSTPDPNDLSIWIFAAPATPNPTNWRLLTQRCLTVNAAERAQAIPAFTARDFQRLPLPAAPLHIQPPNLRTLINVPTNVYTTADPVVLPTTLLGFPVRVRAIPTSYTWAFGDGHTLTTSNPGAPYPALTTTHTYTRPQMATVGLTTTYSGLYSLAGGPWIPIDGTATVASPPTTLTVLSARNELIAGP